MSGENVLAGGLETLYSMKESILELTGYQEQSVALAKEENELGKAIAAKERAVAEEITAVTKKRKEEIENSFEEQINQTKSRQRKVKGKKDKQKGVKITERIQVETSELVEERRQFNEEIKGLLRTNHVSKLFHNSLYYALFLPRSVKDILVILLTVIVCFLILPFGLYEHFLPKTTYSIVLTYFAMIIVFGGLYLFINHWTKEQHPEMIKQIRNLRKKLAVNAKQIHVREKGIKKDQDESPYGLDKFNQEIKELETEISQLVEKKKEALVSFETTTRYLLAEEITNRQKKELDELKEKQQRLYESQRAAEEKAKQFRLEISNRYEAFVGKENMTLEQIDRLIELVESGEASKISDAIELSKKENNSSTNNLFMIKEHTVQK